MWFFVVLAVIGLLLSAAAHVSTFFGVDPQELFPGIWLLHIGIFVVFVPAVVLQGAARRKPEGGGGGKKRDGGNPLANAPRWVRWGVGALFVYTFLNFAL